MEADFESYDAINHTTANTHDSQAAIVAVPGAGVVYETLQHWGIELQLERYLHVGTPLDGPTQDIDNLNAGIYAYW